MIFSKTFGYSLRGILYISVMRDEKRNVGVEEIAAKLAVPRHFMGKILKRLAKEGMLVSVKGPAGGFTLNEATLSLSLLALVNVTDGLSLKTCVIHMKECNSINPCPLHGQMTGFKEQFQNILSCTTIADLLTDNKPDLIKSISMRQ